MLPKITEVERFRVLVPFGPQVAMWNSLMNTGWELLEIVRVQTEDASVVGYGEALTSYPEFCTTDASIAQVVGALPLEHAANDSLGFSLQMALYDAAGRSIGVPIHQLLGRPLVRDRIPISWWNTKMPADLLAREATRAVEAGYLSHKIKARPWFDVHAQVSAISAVTPEEYRIDLDWNSLLGNSARALPVLRELDHHNKVGLFESPISRSDSLGHDRIHRSIDTCLVEHFDAGLFPVWMRDNSMDGFVVSPPGVTNVLTQADAALQMHKDVFLQMCGTGITTAFMAQLNSVLPAARLPAVTVMNTYSDDLLNGPLKITNGLLDLPSGAGLGVWINEDSLESMRVPDSFSILPPRQLLTVTVGDGPMRLYTTAHQLWADYTINATMPVQAPDSNLTVQDDDGSAEFDRMHKLASMHPVWV